MYVEPVQGHGEILDCGPLTPAAAAAEALDEHAFEEYGMQVQWPAIACLHSEDFKVIDHIDAMDFELSRTVFDDL